MQVPRQWEETGAALAGAASPGGHRRLGMEEPHQDKAALAALS